MACKVKVIDWLIFWCFKSYQQLIIHWKIKFCNFRYGCFLYLTIPSLGKILKEKFCNFRYGCFLYLTIPSLGKILKEKICNFRYGCFLYLTIPSLGRILEDKGKQPVAHRKLMELELDPSITRDFPGNQNI